MLIDVGEWGSHHPIEVHASSDPRHTKRCWMGATAWAESVHDNGIIEEGNGEGGDNHQACNHQGGS